jgi:hypothetical protein
VFSVQTTPTLSYVVLPEGTRGFVFTVHETGVPGPPKPRLLDRVRAALRIRHYSRRTEKAYVAWILRYIFFTANATRSRWARPSSHGS